MALDSPALTNLLAETACLGACLLDAAAARLVVEQTRAHDYTLDVYRAVYTAIQRMLSRGEPVDRVAIHRECLALHLDLPSTVCLDLEEAVPTAANVRTYIQHVREATARRTIRQACQRTIRAMEDPGASVPEATAHLAEDVEIALEGNGTGTGPADIVPQKIDAALRQWLAAWDQAPARLTSSGYAALDGYLGGGFEAGELVLLGGRAGTGKSALALEIAVRTAKAGKGVLIVSREMRLRKLLNRLLANAGHVRASVLRSGRLYPADYAKMQAGYSLLSPLPLWLDDRARRLEQICRMVERWAFTPELSLVVVDYLQLVQAPKDIKDRRLQVELVSGELKALAMRTGCVVLALSSLSRAAKSEHDRKPVLQDLRESGELEHDADIICLLHRGFGEAETELGIAKNRDGHVGLVRLHFTGDFLTFDAVSEA